MCELLLLILTAPVSLAFKCKEKCGIACPAICFCIAIGIQLGIGISYFNLASIATNYNERYTYTYSIIGAGNFRNAVISWDESIKVWSFDLQSIGLTDTEPHNWYD